MVRGAISFDVWSQPAMTGAGKVPRARRLDRCAVLESGVWQTTLGRVALQEVGSSGGPAHVGVARDRYIVQEILELA